MAISNPTNFNPPHPVEVLLEAMTDVVAMDMTYQEKKQLVLSTCNETQRTALEEFISWWDESP